MPLVRIENYPPQIRLDLRARLATALKEAWRTGVDGVCDMTNVTVVAGGPQLFETDMTLVILVEDLDDLSQYDNEKCRRLAGCLAACVKKNLSDKWKVKMVIRRFRPGADLYAQINPDT